MAAANPAFKLEWLELELAVCRLDAQAPTPRWAIDLPFVCLMRTDGELSIVAPTGSLPPEGSSARAVLRVEQPWRALRVAGQLPFGLVGVVAALTRPLAEARIPVFVLSTFDTDCVLVKTDMADAASTALRGAGYELAGAPPKA